MSRSHRMDRVPALATALGSVGLLPFCAGPALMYVDPHHRAVYADWLASYALAIFCFLAGVWWGLALIRRSHWALLASNGAVIVAFIGYIALGSREFLLLCAVLFPATVVVERKAKLFRPQPVYYARLRLRLTLVAVSGLVIGAVLV